MSLSCPISSYSPVNNKLIHMFRTGMAYPLKTRGKLEHQKGHNLTSLWTTVDCGWLVLTFSSTYVMSIKLRVSVSTSLLPPPLPLTGGMTSYYESLLIFFFGKVDFVFCWPPFRWSCAIRTMYSGGVDLNRSFFMGESNSRRMLRTFIQLY